VRQDLIIEPLVDQNGFKHVSLPGGAAATRHVVLTTPMAQKQSHVVLLGDSIVDNVAYTRGAPDVLTHLRSLLPGGWRATLLIVSAMTSTGTAVHVLY
jgi:hypothetical protein